MSLLRLIASFTDGKDRGSGWEDRLLCALGAHRDAGVHLLSCGIGQEADHDSLARLASAAEGLHVALESSEQLGIALTAFAQFIEGNAKQASVVAQCRLSATKPAAVPASVQVGRRPVDLLVLIDSCPAMMGHRAYNDWSGDALRLVRSKETAKALVSLLNPQCDRVCVSGFGGVSPHLKGFSGDFGAACLAIDRLGGDSTHSPFSAIRRAVQEFKQDESLSRAR